MLRKIVQRLGDLSHRTTLKISYFEYIIILSQGKFSCITERTNELFFLLSHPLHGQSEFWKKIRYTRNKSNLAAKEVARILVGVIKNLVFLSIFSFFFFLLQDAFLFLACVICFFFPLLSFFLFSYVLSSVVSHYHPSLRSSIMNYSTISFYSSSCV